MSYSYENEVRDLLNEYRAHDPVIVAAIIQGAATIRAATVIEQALNELATGEITLKGLGGQIQEGMHNVSAMLDLLQRVLNKGLER